MAYLDPARQQQEDELLMRIKSLSAPKDLTPDSSAVAQANSQLGAGQVPSSAPPVAPQGAPDLQAAQPPSNNPYANTTTTAEQMPKEFKEKVLGLMRGNMPDFSGQEETVGGQRAALLANLQNTPQLNLQPLNSLTDAWTGSQFAKNYTQPNTPQEQALLTSKLQEALGQGQSGLNKEKESLLLKGLQELFTPKPTGVGSTYRTDQNVYKNILNKLDNDKMLQQRIGQSNNLINEMSNFMDGKYKTPQQFAAWQQGLRNNLGLGKNSTGAERGEDYYKGLGLNKTSVLQFLSTMPKNVDANYYIDHLKDLTTNELKNITAQSHQRISSLVAGQEHFFANHPELAQDLYNKIKAVGKQFSAVPPADNKITVKSPDGEIGEIPASQLEDALSQGYTRE